MGSLTAVEAQVLVTLVMCLLGLVIGVVGMVYSFIHDLKHSTGYSPRMPGYFWVYFYIAVVMGSGFGFSIGCFRTFGALCRATYL